MRLTDILCDRATRLDEAVAIGDRIHLAAFAITVAEAYAAMPQVDPSVVPLWQALAKQNAQVMLRQIASSGITIVRSAADEYGDRSDDPRMMLRYMLWDMVVNHRLSVYTGHSDDHPAFSADDNAVFRTVHDYFTHGTLRRVFQRQIDALQLGDTPPSPAQLAQLLPHIRLDQGGNRGHTFGLRGEINTYLTHSRLAGAKLRPVLFTEVIGQACYQTVVGQFPQQKVGLLHGFDLFRIGLAQPANGPVAQRMAALRRVLPTQSTVPIRIAAQPTVEVRSLLATLAP